MHLMYQGSAAFPGYALQFQLMVNDTSGLNVIDTYSFCFSICLVIFSTICWYLANKFNYMFNDTQVTVNRFKYEKNTWTGVLCFRKSMGE